jgi:hypothetical protein
MPCDPTRKPVRALLRAKPDRRLNRPNPPSCACGHDDTRVTVRTVFVLYFRCPQCGAVWSAPKPGEERYGT